ncbi:MAG: DUF4132 domain-containing protein [Planctomycetes bacterium]|nr:DUF4132 domain-containing protein [Planctomycetota bacterium]
MITPATRANVTLWHPALASTAEVLAWRLWVEEHQVTQPFKQAHREVYLLTDAERDTHTYSNRFAAHILRQSQFRALAKTRGWETPFLGPWDAGSVGQPQRQLPVWQIRSELWLGAASDAFAPSGGYLFVSTDQVRFYQTGDAAPMPLAEVPLLVFTEVMRDMDLFVGVASVANDPTWHDVGPDHLFIDYWHEYSFGELSATAQTRRQVLERLVPRLKVAERCSLSDRFLTVRGDIHTYKIHLGSGNILMSPNDQYLCIVSKQSAAAGERGGVFLPFEGDNTLSIIVSKAFLLAEDTKIKDPTIVSQIK